MIEYRSNGHFIPGVRIQQCLINNRQIDDAPRLFVAEPANPVLGFHCYHWDPYHRGGRSDTGYGIQGKPAYEVVRDGLAGIQARFEEILAPPPRPTSRPADRD